MHYEFTESHMILTFAKQGVRIRMTLDEADALRGIIESQLYRKHKQFTKVKEQQCESFTSIGHIVKGKAWRHVK